MRAVSTDEILDWVRRHPLPDGRIIPICLWGERGVGKTAWVAGYCQQRELGFRAYHPAHDRTGADIVGLANIEENTNRTVYARPMWLPSDSDRVVFEHRGVLFIDELNRAPMSVLRGLMEPIGEGRIEQSNWRLPANWGFVCAANPPTDGYDVEVLDESLMNRMLHVPMGFDEVRWTAWAQEHDVHADVVSFAAINHETAVAPSHPRLPDELSIQGTPRTLEYLARLYEPTMDRDLLTVIANGLIGRDAGKEFMKHLDAHDNPVTADEVFAGGDFTTRLAQQRSDGRDDLLSASVTMMVAALTRYGESPEASGRVADYLSALGPDMGHIAWTKIENQAPHWVPPLRAEAKRRKETPGAPV